MPKNPHNQNYFHLKAHFTLHSGKYNLMQFLEHPPSNTKFGLQAKGVSLNLRIPHN